MAFMGLPCPKKITGMRGDGVKDGIRSRFIVIEIFSKKI
jgi:hypothetical protein